MKKKWKLLIFFLISSQSFSLTWEETIRKSIDITYNFFITDVFYLINNIFNFKGSYNLKISEVQQVVIPVGIALAMLFASFSVLYKLEKIEAITIGSVLKPVSLLSLTVVIIQNAVGFLNIVKNLFLRIVNIVFVEFKNDFIDIEFIKTALTEYPNQAFQLFMFLLFVLLLSLTFFSLVILIITLIFRQIKLVALATLAPLYLSGFASEYSWSFATGYLKKYINTILELYFIFVGLNLVSKLGNVFTFKSYDVIYQLLSMFFSSLSTVVLAVYAPNILSSFGTFIKKSYNNLRRPKKNKLQYDNQTQDKK